MFHVIVINKKDVQIQRLMAPRRTAEEVEERLDNAARIVRGIRARVFPRVNDIRTCKGRCGFFRQCKPDWYATIKSDKEASDG